MGVELVGTLSNQVTVPADRSRLVPGWQMRRLDLPDEVVVAVTACLRSAA